MNDEMKQCIYHAVNAGHTATEARKCELYSVACPACPLAITVSDQEALEEAMEKAESL